MKTTNLQTSSEQLVCVSTLALQLCKLLYNLNPEVPFLREDIHTCFKKRSGTDNRHSRPLYSCSYSKGIVRCK